MWRWFKRIRAKNVSSDERIVKEKPLHIGPSIGTFLGCPIPEWVFIHNSRYEYAGQAPGPGPGLVDLSMIADNEVCVTPGLLYRRSVLS